MYLNIKKNTSIISKYLHLAFLLSPIRFALGTALFFACILALSSCGGDKDENPADKPYVVVLSIDGCRWDYPDIAEMPHLDLMAKEGIKADGIIPSYPTKTFPNHYSMATGLYPDHHGIVQNNFYDAESDKYFTMSNRAMVEDSIFWQGEAIWETAERQGVRTAAFFWVGTESNETYRPSVRKQFDKEIPFETRIDSAVSWLYLPERVRPHLILFYFEEPDGVGHKFGPDSQETKLELARLDSLIGVTMGQIQKAEKDLDIEVNFIVTSDHGMGHIPADQNIFLEEHINIDDIQRYAGGNPVYLLQPVDGKKEELLADLRTVPHLNVWEKGELPLHYHYGSHKRIFDIVVESDPGWGVQLKKRNISYSLGTHGYDPENPDMHAIFYAMGPAFKKGYSQAEFENVCLYPLLAEILGLNPASVDGDLNLVKGMLKEY